MGVFSLLGVYSCEKTDSLLNSNNQKPDSFSKLTYQRGKGTSVSKPIVLGKKYDNPYAVKNITAAWNEYITNVENPAITLDNVSGYTLAELQNALAGTVSWSDFISKLPAKQVADRNRLLTTRSGGYGLQ